jgi:type III secretory pathway component EscS
MIANMTKLLIDRCYMVFMRWCGLTISSYNEQAYVQVLTSMFANAERAGKSSLPFGIKCIVCAQAFWKC